MNDGSKVAPPAALQLLRSYTHTHVSVCRGGAERRCLLLSANAKVSLAGESSAVVMEVIVASSHSSHLFPPFPAANMLMFI